MGELMKSPLFWIVILLMANVFLRYEHTPYQGHMYEHDRLTGSWKEVPLNGFTTTGNLASIGGENFSPYRREGRFNTKELPIAQAPTPDTLALALQSNDSNTLRRTQGSGISPSNTAQITRPYAMPHGTLYGFHTVNTSQAESLSDKTFRSSPPLPLNLNTPETARRIKQDEPIQAFSSQTGDMVSQTLDLNRDGTSEKLLTHTENRRSGLNNFSILTQGQRELFYGKGQSLQPLASQHYGWQDIALTVRPGYQLIYTYQPQIGGYQLGSQNAF
ncbi:MAG: hypothetical protein ACKO37_04715 [Vampirovibrionales bacterium]